MEADKIVFNFEFSGNADSSNGFGSFVTVGQLSTRIEGHACHNIVTNARTCAMSAFPLSLR